MIAAGGVSRRSEQWLAAGGGIAWAPAWWPGGRGGLQCGLDGVGHELRGLRVDGDGAAEQHAADDLPGVREASCRPSAMSALRGEVGVHGGAVHTDGLGELGHWVDSTLDLMQRMNLPREW